MTPLKDLLGHLSVRSKTPRHLRHVTSASNDGNESVANFPSFSRVQRQLFSLGRPSSRAELNSTPTRPATSLAHYQTQIHSPNHDHTQGDRSCNDSNCGEEGHVHHAIHVKTRSNELLLAGPEYATPRTTTPFLSTMSGAENNPFFSPSPLPSHSQPPSVPESSPEYRPAHTNPRSLAIGRHTVRRSTKSIPITRSNSIPGSRSRRELSDNFNLTPKSNLVGGQGTPIRPLRPDERAAMEVEKARNEILTIEEALASPPFPSVTVLPSSAPRQKQEREIGPQVMFPQRSASRLALSPTRSGTTENSTTTTTTPRQSPQRLRLKLKRSDSTVKLCPKIDSAASKPGIPPFIARGPERGERVPNVEKLDEWWSGLGAEKKMATKEIFESLSGLFDSTYPCLIPKDAYESSYLDPSDQEGV